MIKREHRTGLYRVKEGRVKDSQAVVVYWHGREIARYETTSTFVDAHYEGVAALAQQQDDYLMDLYKDS